MFLTGVDRKNVSVSEYPYTMHYGMMRSTFIYVRSNMTVGQFNLSQGIKKNKKKRNGKLKKTNPICSEETVTEDSV